MAERIPSLKLTGQRYALKRAPLDRFCVQIGRETRRGYRGHVSRPRAASQSRGGGPLRRRGTPSGRQQRKPSDWRGNPSDWPCTTASRPPGASAEARGPVRRGRMTLLSASRVMHIRVRVTRGRGLIVAVTLPFFTPDWSPLLFVPLFLHYKPSSSGQFSFISAVAATFVDHCTERALFRGQGCAHHLPANHQQRHYLFPPLQPWPWRFFHRQHHS